MLVNVYGAKCIGIDAVRVVIEVFETKGVGVSLTGLPDVAVKESLLRTTTALESTGLELPGRRIVINLAPADVRKCGTGFDLPIALGIIATTWEVVPPLLGEFIIMGELGLDGSIRAIPGALPIAEMARAEGFRGCILPAESAMEAAELQGITVYGARTLDDVLRIVRGGGDCSELVVGPGAGVFAAGGGPGSLRGGPGSGVTAAVGYPGGTEPPDFSEIIGQDGAKRGAEIAIAGGHNLLMVGSPGSGKSSLAKALTGILPPMTQEESIVTSKIYSICGKGSNGLMRTRPFRSPHYSASMAAIIGGGGGDGILPGEVSLAQNGILFLDEVCQMPRSTLEALRAPLEDRKVCISRLKNKIEFPASFMLVAAANPCPCGYWGEPGRCTCTPGQRQAYLGRLSGPLLDRIDVKITVRRVPPSELRNRSAAGTAGGPALGAAAAGTAGDSAGGAAPAEGAAAAGGSALAGGAAPSRGAAPGSLTFTSPAAPALGAAPSRGAAPGSPTFTSPAAPSGPGPAPGTQGFLVRREQETSAEVAARIIRAREIQKRRFRAESITTNSEMSNRLIAKYCPLSDECTEAMTSLMEKSDLSMRAYFRIIKVARTIADLEESPDILPSHLIEAAAYRLMEFAE